MGKCWKISHKLHGSGRRRVRKKTFQNQQMSTMSHFSSLCQLQLPISQNRSVPIVSYFVGVRRKCVLGPCFFFGIYTFLKLFPLPRKTGTLSIHLLLSCSYMKLSLFSTNSVKIGDRMIYKKEKISTAYLDGLCCRRARFIGILLAKMRARN